MIKIKRIYDKYEEGDGLRILVDRLWPRGVSKERAKLDLWLKDIAPSTELRKWFNHDPEKWIEFKKRYQQELKANTDSVSTITKLIQQNSNLSLLYGAKDELHNEAVVLQAFLDKK